MAPDPESGDNPVAEAELRDEIDDALAGVAETHTEVAVEHAIDGGLSAGSHASGRPQHVTAVGVGDIGHLSDKQVARCGDQWRAAVVIGKKRNRSGNDRTLVLDAAVVGVGDRIRRSGDAAAPPWGVVVGGIRGIQTGASGIELENLRRASTTDRGVDPEFLSARSNGPVMQGDVDCFGNDRLGSGAKRQGREGEQKQATQGFQAALM